MYSQKLKKKTGTWNRILGSLVVSLLWLCSGIRCHTTVYRHRLCWSLLLLPSEHWGKSKMLKLSNQILLAGLYKFWSKEVKYIFIWRGFLKNYSNSLSVKILFSSPNWKPWVSGRIYHFLYVSYLSGYLIIMSTNDSCYFWQNSCVVKDYFTYICSMKQGSSLWLFPQSCYQWWWAWYHREIWTHTNKKENQND